jgi:hypothetical protein
MKIGGWKTRSAFERYALVAQSDTDVDSAAPVAAKRQVDLWHFLWTLQCDVEGQPAGDSGFFSVCSSSFSVLINSRSRFP